MILQIGAGAVGSYLSAALAKSGNSIELFDGDSIERKNVFNQWFTHKDIKRNKAEVMAENFSSIHAFPFYWQKGKVISQPTFVLAMADRMSVRREIFEEFSDIMCFDVRLIQDTYTIYAGLGKELLDSAQYKDDDPDIVGLTPPCHMPSCRADLVLVAVGHCFRNVVGYMKSGKPIFKYSVGNLEKGFHYEEREVDTKPA